MMTLFLIYKCHFGTISFYLAKKKGLITCINPMCSLMYKGKYSNTKKTQCNTLLCNKEMSQINTRYVV